MPAHRPVSSVSDKPRIDAAAALAELQTRSSDGSPRVNRGPQQLLQGEGDGASPPAHATDTVINSGPDHGSDGPQPPVRKSTRPRAPRRQYSPPPPAARASHLRRPDPPAGANPTAPNLSSPASMPPRTSQPDTSAPDNCLGLALRKWKLATPDDILPGYTPPNFSNTVCKTLWKLARSNQPIQEVRTQILAHIESRQRRGYAAYLSEPFITEPDVTGAQLVLDVKSARRGIAQQDPAGPASQAPYPDTTHQGLGSPASHRQSPTAEEVGGQVTPPASVEMNINVAGVPSNTPSPSPSPPVGRQFPTGQDHMGAGAARVRPPNGYSPAAPATNGYATAHQPPRPPSSPARQQTSVTARSATDPAAATRAQVPRVVSPFDRQGPQPWTTPQRRQPAQASRPRQGGSATAPVADMGTGASDPIHHPSPPQSAMNIAAVVESTLSETPAARSSSPAFISKSAAQERIRELCEQEEDLKLELMDCEIYLAEAYHKMSAFELKVVLIIAARHRKRVEAGLAEWHTELQEALARASAVRSSLDTLMGMAQGEHSLFQDARDEFGRDPARQVNGSAPGSAGETSTSTTFRSLVRSLLNDKAYWEQDVADKKAKRRTIDVALDIKVEEFETAASDDNERVTRAYDDKKKAEDGFRSAKRARLGGG